MENLQKLLRSKILFSIFCLVVVYGLFGSSGGLLESRLAQAIWNFNHLIAFFIGTIFLFNLFPITRPVRIINIILLLSAILIISGGIEYVQKFVGRNASYDDIALNMAGSLLAITAYLIFTKQVSALNILQACVFVVASGILSWPNIRFFLAEFINYKQFPVLADFSKPFALNSWRATDAELTLNSKNELEIQFLPGHDYSNIIFESFYNDWSRYRDLVIEIRNPEQQPLDVIVRLHDIEHKNHYSQFDDRYNRPVELRPGKNTITIPVIDIYKAPKSRRMDLDKLEQLIIFTADLEERRSIIIEKMYLR